MNRHILTAIAVVAVGTVALPSANAAKPKPKPKPFTKTVTFSDSTPDPSAGAIASDVDASLQVCDGTLPREAAIPVKIPAAGKLKVEISGFQGDWGLSIRDAAGNFLAGDDVNPTPSQSNLTTGGPFEAVTYKAKKAGTFGILPCNLGGQPSATVKYTYTPS